MGKRTSNGEEFWWIPGGSIEGEEDAFQALARELEEEIELTADLKHAVNRASSQHDESMTYQNGNTTYQIFFLEVPASSINQTPAIREEFDQLKWFSTNELPENVSREFSYIKAKVLSL